MNMAFGKIMKQAQQMQKNLARVREELAAREVTATVGGGALKLVFSGDQILKAVTLNPEVLKDADAEMLQDLILAAVNQGLEESRKLSEAEMQKVTGNLSIPGLDMGGLGF